MWFLFNFCNFEKKCAWCISPVLIAICWMAHDLNYDKGVLVQLMADTCGPFY